MANLRSIDLKLSQSLTQVKEAILVFSKQPQALQAQMNSKKTVTEKPATDKKQSLNNSKSY